MNTWIKPSQQLPPQFEEVKILVYMHDNFGVKIEQVRRAVYMEGSWYSSDMSHCITHKIEGWRPIMFDSQYDYHSAAERLASTNA